LPVPLICDVDLGGIVAYIRKAMEGVRRSSAPSVRLNRPMSTPRPIRLKVASPCKVPWDSMNGDAAVRFCGKCERHVYNLSEMTAEQTEALLADPSGRPCVRFFQRADGTVMTADCPVGARRARRQHIALGVGAGLLTALGYAAIPDGAATAPSPPAMAPLRAHASPPVPVEPTRPAMMGKIMRVVPPSEKMGQIAAPREALVELQGDVIQVR
jgi:hypothetical protein